MFVLDRKGLPHGHFIIKVYSHSSSPTDIFAKSHLRSLKIDHSRLKPHEVFDYTPRAVYTGQDIESSLSLLALTPDILDQARSLFRFANLPQIRSAQTAMELTDTQNRFIIDHPLEVIDCLIPNPCIKKKSSPPHLDIFHPETLNRLFHFLNLTPADPELHRYLVTVNDHLELLRSRSKER